MQDETTQRVRRGAIGVLRHGTEILMVRRAAGRPKGGLWCFPGGHIEIGETSRQAIVREVAEELGIEVLPTRRLGSVRVVDSRYVLVVWGLMFVRGQFQPAVDEIAEYRWFHEEELRTVHPSIASNARVFELLGV